MGNLIQIFCTLLVQIEVGLTPKNRPAHKTVRIPFIRPDATQEEIIAFIDFMRPAMAGPITGVRLETKTVTTVWTPELRDAKKQRENEGEETNTANARQVREVTQMTVGSASQTQTSQVQATNAVMGETNATRSSGQLGLNSFPGSRLEKGLEHPGIKAEAGVRAANSPLGFMARMRQNGYKVTLDEMTRSPFANTISTQGSPPPAGKADVPIYSDAQHFQ
ncbi:hypothetical protein LJC40_02860 [Synergistaceae bacterium OttesenSCG-928-D05]|nr:hypothetical protein [Synergistaceae bacterium OttesenSCG-928-D05]